jgi:hypothetical protein
MYYSDGINSNIIKRGINHGGPYLSSFCCLLHS